MANAAMMDAIPTTTTAVAVTRMRIPAGRRRTDARARSATVGRQSVPGSADGLDRVPAERTVELRPQMPHVDLDDVEVAVEATVPDVIEDVGLRNDVTAVTEQELQQGHLARGERDLHLAPPRTSLPRIEPEVPRFQHRRSLHGSATDQRPEPGDERHVREGFGDEVVGAGVERLRLVELAVLGGQHQDRRPVPLFAKRRADAISVDPRQHDVEDDRVVRMLARHPQTIGPVRRTARRPPPPLYPLA